MSTKTSKLMSKDSCERFEAAIRLSKGKRYAEAIRILDGLLETECARGFLAAIHGYLGGIYVHGLGQPAPAERHYRESSKLSPKSERASLGLFHALIDQGRITEAFDEAGRLLAGRDSLAYRRVFREMGEELPGRGPRQASGSDDTADA